MVACKTEQEVIPLSFMSTKELFTIGHWLSQHFTSPLFYQDAGYGEKSLFSCEDDNDDPESKNIDDEVALS